MRGIKGLAAAAAVALAAPAAVAQDKGDRLVVCDFEDLSVGANVIATKIPCEFTDDPSGAPGHVGKWTVPAYDKNVLLDFKGVPEDFTAWKFVRFRLRRESGAASLLFVRVQTTRSDELTVRIPGVGKEWRTYEFDLDRFYERGSPDPRKVKNVSLCVADNREGVFFVDDLVLAKEPLPVPPEATARSAAKTWSAGTFDGEAALEWVGTMAATATVVAEKGNSVLRGALDANGKPSSVDLLDLPRDFDEYRALRFRIRVEGDPGKEIRVRFMAGYDDGMAFDLKEAGKAWKDVEIPISCFSEVGTFDPARMDRLTFAVYEGAACTIFLDDVRLERPTGDAAADDRARFEYVFGKGAAAKGIHFQVSDFDVWTDSRGAATPLKGGLEKIYAFLLGTLDLPSVKRKIPIYAFQNVNGLREYLMRARGFDKKRADGINALGNGGYVAFYYRTPDDAAIVRNIAQCLFHRNRGRHGGSWLQSGVGHYAGARWEKRSPAAEFAPRIRSKSFLPLADLVAVPDLFAGVDVKGGAGESDSLFLQAAALQEFLRRGPLKEKWAGAEKAVARMTVPPKDRVGTLERILGMSMGDLEKAWIEWGSNPPKE